MTKELLPVGKRLRFFAPREYYSNGWSQMTSDSRQWEKIYRQRWQYDKIVRTTHGVNCTGSCSWKVFVKDGLIAWENQQTDYPSTGPDMPEFEPRGCPRGASFSWYVYSPLRVKYPYVRGVLLTLWRQALHEHGNALLAWKSIVENPSRARQYKEARGKGGLLRATWDEVNQMIAAAMLYTAKTYGPDRMAGFTPIPAMSMVSYASGARFLSLVGAAMLSFYDWYADLPPASPQIWGEQTDVPESSDWYNAGYIVLWGSNVPMTRTPDAHFLTEVRYKGTKVVAVSPDYAENVKFADNWLAPHPGSDGAMAQAMTHVILKEFYVKQRTPYFLNYVKRFTDLPFLVKLKKTSNGFLADHFLSAADIKMETPNAEWKPLLLDEDSQFPVCPKGTLGHRWENKGRWNLKQEDENGDSYHPLLSLEGIAEEKVAVEFPYFDDSGKSSFIGFVPVKQIECSADTVYVATVFDLMLANYNVYREDLSTDAANIAYTPEWQELITGVKAESVRQIAREFAQNAIDTKGRSMIIMGAGINHWFHSDATYRAILNLVLLTGCEGVSGGGWAHYVGQEKCRPIEGWQTLAFARDWSMPPRLQNAASFYYFATSQWRYDELNMNRLAAATVPCPRYRHAADYNVLAARLGWLPSYPQFNQNSATLVQEAEDAGCENPEEVRAYVVKQLKEKKLSFAIEDPDSQKNFPRILFVWRANLLSSSGKGHEFFLKHLLGTTNAVFAEENSENRPKEVKWREEAATGKLDLLVSLDFRMAGNALYSDIVLPAATWYEKHDLSSTDMHPFVHPFNPALEPAWEAKSDWDIFRGLAKEFSHLAQQEHIPQFTDVVTVPLMHDSPDETAQAGGRVLDWSKGETELIPGKTMPKLAFVQRDYTQVYDKFISLGPNAETKPIGANGVSFLVTDEYEQLRHINGVIETSGAGQGRPSIETARQAAEAILTLSSATNGRVAVRAWTAEEKKTSVPLKDLAQNREADTFRFEDITVRPKQVIPTPVFTGTGGAGRRYSPFTTSTERFVPFRTLTGRQHFYLDHDLMFEFGEALPVYKPTLPEQVFAPGDKIPKENGEILILRYLTPHGKWNIHSMYQDDLHMLTLFRGGPNVWMNYQDAQRIGVQDNDWVEVYNRSGVVTARAVITHRMPRGTLYMYHAQDRHVNVPGSAASGERGGTHNSPTQIHLKPTQMIGGYAQLSYGFNYYGPIGNQRDGYVAVRRLKEVDWLEN